MGNARLAVWIAIPVLTAAAGVSGQIGSPQISTGTGTPTPTVAPPPKAPVPPDAPGGFHGRVIAADTGRPLYRARVRLQAHGSDRLELSAMTDRNGEYRFDGIPAGSYALYSSRIGFLEMRPGQKRPGDRTGPTDISAGEVQRVDFALPRGSVIYGRITDGETGEPLAGAYVTALRFQHSFNGVRLMPGYGMQLGGRTDDRGEFRIAGLSPGTYVIAAGVDTNTRGDAYAATYYPGTRSLSEARRFRVGVSEEATASFSMMTTQHVRVAGQARSSSGEPLQNFRVLLRAETVVGTKNGQVRDASGSFEFEGVPPGAYTLEIAPMPMGRAGSLRQTEFVSLPIEIGEQDITGLLVTTGLGATISGRVIYDGTSPRTAAQTGQRPRVLGTIVDSAYGFGQRSADPNNGIIAEDGSFTITAGSGKMLFRTTMPGWQLKSVTLDGADITDVPYDTARGGTSRLEVVVTDQRQEVTGRVVDALGKPPAGFVVLAFPRALKDGAVPGRFFARSSTYNSDGTFLLSNLPPGNYFAAAFTSVPDDAYFDVDFHASVKDRATPFDLPPGETVKLELSLIE